MWSDEKDEERLYQRAIQESYRILGKDGRDRRGWTREEMIEASGLSEPDFRSTYLDFLEGGSWVVIFLTSVFPGTKPASS